MMIRSRLLAYALAGLAFPAARPVLAERSTLPVKVSGGEIVGTDDGTLKTYLGVPFAAPPVGALRWRRPQPVVAWRGVRKTHAFSAACAQTADWISNPKSEDCLYLNIWAPAKARKLPVIVWIHGGGMYGGTAAVPVHNGANLAKRGAIVVTMNYRLGIFGFFALPELSVETPEHVSGNQGILDQIAALRWVRNNIAAFGGDPDRVTIMGNSAGSESVAILVASPLAKGLFQRAIGESGNDAMPIRPDDDHRFDHEAAAEAKGAAFAKAIGAEHLADLRKLSVAELHKQAWLPRVHVDGYLLRADLTTIYRNHQQNDVPLLVGWTAEEGKDLVGEYVDTRDSTAAKHEDQITKITGLPPSATLLTAYPGTTDAEAVASLAQLTNDWWGWRMEHWAALQAQYGRSKSYLYYFAHRPTAPSTPCNWGCGAGHGVDIQYMFDNLAIDPRSWTPQDKQLATRLADTVVRFARTGNPAGTGSVRWPAFDGSKDTILTIGNEAELKAHPLPDFSPFDRPAGK
jgi:para-nitrobenzyl esterase